MITLERFQKNINIIHLAYISGNDDIVLKIMKGIFNHFPDKKEELDHFVFFINFGLLEGFEISVDEFYKELTK